MTENLNFGIHKNRTIEEINKIDHQYIVFLSTIKPIKSEYMRNVVQQCQKLVNQQEQQITINSVKYHKQKCKETTWLIKWLGNMATSPDTRTASFCQSVRKQLMLEHRIDKISFKQMQILLAIWTKEYGENSKQKFLKHFNGKWIRKTHSLNDL